MIGIWQADSEYACVLFVGLVYNIIMATGLHWMLTVQTKLISLYSGVYLWEIFSIVAVAKVQFSLEFI